MYLVAPGRKSRPTQHDTGKGRFLKILGLCLSLFAHLRLFEAPGVAYLRSRSGQFSGQAYGGASGVVSHLIGIICQQRTLIRRIQTFSSAIMGRKMLRQLLRRLLSWERTPDSERRRLGMGMTRGEVEKIGKEKDGKDKAKRQIENKKRKKTE